MGETPLQSHASSKKCKQKLKDMLQVKFFYPKIPNLGNEKPLSSNLSEASSGNVKLVFSVTQSSERMQTTILILFFFFLIFFFSQIYAKYAINYNN